jgi:hypothetical protein
VNKEELSWLVKGTSTTEASEEKTSNQSRPSGAGSESSGGEIPLGRIDDGQKDKPSSGSRSGGEDGTSYRRPADVSREYPYDYGDRRPDYPGQQLCSKVSTLLVLTTTYYTIVYRTPANSTVVENVLYWCNMPFRLCM